MNLISSMDILRCLSAHHGCKEGYLTSYLYNFLQVLQVHLYICRLQDVLASFCVNSIDQEIVSFWNTQTSLSGNKNNHALVKITEITFSLLRCLVQTLTEAWIRRQWACVRNIKKKNRIQQDCNHKIYRTQATSDRAQRKRTVKSKYKKHTTVYLYFLFYFVTLWGDRCIRISLNQKLRADSRIVCG